MKNLRFSLAVLAATMACAACTVDQTETIEAKRRIEIAAEMEETRTELNYDGKFLWSAGDEIGVFGLTTKNARFATDIQHSSAYATFAGEIGYNDQPKYCYYPYVEGANDSKAIPFNLQQRQLVSLNEGNYILGPNNPKSGTLVEVSEGNYSTSVKSHMSLLKFKINANGTELQGMRLDKVTIKRDGAALTGNFKANIETGVISPVNGETYDYAETVIETRPYLNGQVQSYAMVYPDMPAGAEFVVEIMASDENGSKTASLKRKASKAWQDGYTYTMTLNLDEYDLTYTNATEKNFTSFKFEAAKNAGKILATELYYNNSSYSAKTTTRSVTAVSATVDTENKTVDVVIPYLYDFKLAATFTVPSGVSVYVGSTKQVSGVTVNDFSNTVIYRLVAGEGTKNEVETQYAVNIANTGLPVVVVNQSSTLPTGGQWVNWSNTGIKLRSKESEWAEDDYITIYNPDGTINVDNKACGVRLRGNVTQEFPKKPFAIKFDKKQEVLGMPAHKRWCLLANWIDRTGIRNDVAVALANQTVSAWQNEGLEEGLTYNPRGQHVEVVYNGIHVGNYLLCEQIKIDENRVNIQKEYDEEKPKGIYEVGYLIEFDDGLDENFGFKTSYRNLPCQLKDDVTDEHWTYVKNKVQGIENNLYSGKYSTAYEDLDIYSVIDQWFIFELAMNDEYRHPKSVYYYMDGDKKLKAGPVWDFDWQTFPYFTGISQLGGRKPNYGTSINIMMYTKQNTNSSWFSEDAPYMWYPYLVKDKTIFNAAVKERWNVMKPYLLGVSRYIDMLAEQNAVSMEYDKAMWPLESKERKSTHNFSGDERMTYEESIETLKKFINDRIAVMDSHFNSL